MRKGNIFYISCAFREMIPWLLVVGVHAYLPGLSGRSDANSSLEIDEEKQMEVIEAIISSEHYNRYM